MTDNDPYMSYKTMYSHLEGIKHIKQRKKHVHWSREYKRLHLYFIHEMKYKSLNQIEIVTIVRSKNRK